jgi:predicted MFS family arabinose efflux permease
MGTWAQQVAEPWLLLSLGASSFLVGVDAFALDAPGWLLTLVGGVLADRADRRRVITLFQSIQMLCPTLLVVLLVTGAVRPWMIIGLSLIVGVTDALSMPSFQTIVPTIVQREQIGAGLALSSTQFNLSRILGPALAGLLMARAGATACFAANAASYVPFILVALWILPRSTQQGAPRLDGRDPLVGAGIALRDPQLRGALLTVLVTSLFCTPLVTFCPVLVKNVFHGDASLFSLTISAFGVGGLLGATSMLSMDGARNLRRRSTWAALALAVIVMLASLSPWFWGLPVLLVLAGGAMNLSNIPANTLLQSSADPRLRGQTISLYMLALRGGASLGNLFTGLSVSAVGPRHALLINGALAVLLQLAIGRAWFRSSRPPPAVA